MKASSTKMEPTEGSTKDLILHKVDLIMPRHAITSSIGLYPWTSTKPSKYTPISLVQPTRPRFGSSWLRSMVGFSCVAGDYGLWLIQFEIRHYNPRESAGLRSVIRVKSPNCWIKKAEQMWRFPMTAISPWPHGSVRSLVRGWSASLPTPGIYTIRPVSNVRQKLSRYCIEPLAKFSSDSPFPAILLLFFHHLYHGMHHNLQDENGAGTEQAYLSVIWGGEERICFASDFRYHLINSYTSLVEHESVPIYLWLFLLPSSNLVFDGEWKHQLCAQGGQLGVSVGSRRRQFFFFLYSFSVFGCFQSGRLSLEILLGVVEARGNGETNSVWRKPCCETEKEEHTFKGRKKNETQFWCHIFFISYLIFDISSLMIIIHYHHPHILWITPLIPHAVPHSPLIFYFRNSRSST